MGQRQRFHGSDRWSIPPPSQSNLRSLAYYRPMLKQITIQNLILIENASVEFGSGLTIITGETGSGKSAVMQGIRWITGERADTSMIRHGAAKGIVEAVFD